MMLKKNIYLVLWFIFSLYVCGPRASWGQNPVTLVEDPQSETPTVNQATVQPTSQGTTLAEQVSTKSDEEVSQDKIEEILKSQGIPMTQGNIDLVGSANYTLGTMDVIEITVMRHSEVSGQYMVNKEGNIQYEFIGDVTMAGLTKKTATDLLAKKLSQYIISPEVSVKILGYNSKVIYVVGEVGHPGKIFMQGDTITVREALVQAGLPLLSAKVGKCKLITPSDNKPLMKDVNVQKLLYEGDLRENYIMKPGDTLYIPPTFLAKTMRVLQPIAQPIGEAAGTGRTVMTGF